MTGFTRSFPSLSSESARVISIAGAFRDKAFLGNRASKLVRPIELQRLEQKDFFLETLRLSLSWA